MTTYAPSADNLVIGRGVGYFAEIANGVLGGEEHLGNITSLTIKASQEVKEKYESQTSQSALYDRVPMRTTFTLTLTGDEFTLGNIKRLLAGKVGAITQTAGTVAAETLTANAQPGLYYPLAKRKVSNVVVKVGSTAKVEGTDYTVDARTGRIYIVPTGSIAKGATVVVDYAYENINLATIEAGANATQYAMFRFISDNVRGANKEVIVPKVSLTLDSEYGLISDDYGNWTLTASVLALPGQAPFTVINL